jgi:Asp-tRNA(Asn)/Glu-tRNA(Gln) amidotransferase A subunit family amidase
MLAELAAAVRGGRVSAAELVRRSLDRIDRLDEQINAVVLVRAEDVIAEARATDARVTAGDDPGPLAGLPLLVKDNEDVAGLPTTFASKLFADSAPAARDCDAVARLRGAGAIVVGKTNLPEFALDGFTDNSVFGTTRNPWGQDWSPGGSSGGSAAALTMGLATIATGTDGGGSVRIPAAFCGLVGLKPTNGLLGRDPIPSWIDLSTKGPLATSVADAELLLRILRSPTAGDPWQPPPAVAGLPGRPRRIVACDRLVARVEPLEGSVGSSFEQALAALEGASGLPIERIDSPLPVQADDDWFTLIGPEERTWVGPDADERSGDLTGNARTAFAYAREVSLEDYIGARRRRYEYARTIDELLRDDTVLVCPTMCVEGILADGRSPGQPERDVLGTDAAWYNTQAVNLCGLPAVSLPAGLSANGIPFGLQLTGPRWTDGMLLSLAARWERAQPWPAVAPGYEPFDVP